MSVADNLGNILARIENAALRRGRNPESVRLVAVSKTKPAEAVMEAMKLIAG